MKREIAMTSGFQREAGRLLKQHRLTPRELSEAIDATTLRRIGVELPERGKESDLIVWRENKDWLYLMDACSTHGPVDVTRKHELIDMFGDCGHDLIYVSCFPSRKVMQGYLGDLAWETEAWCADTPDHMIHLDGEKFMGVYRWR